MSEAKFTKGEWKVTKIQDRLFRIGSGCSEIAKTIRWNGSESHKYNDEVEANAYIMAAAPEMYEEIERDLDSLYNFVKTLAEYSNDWLFYINEIKRKEYLLAKARGEHD